MNTLHRHLQGHLARHHRQPVRPHRRAAAGAGRRRLAQVLPRRAAVRRRDLLRLLLRDVALQPLGRAAPQHRHPPQLATRGPACRQPIRSSSSRSVNKWYGQFHVLRDIDLAVARGERIVICGPSGSGKSTLIRCINRLEEHQQGTLSVDGVELTDDVKAIEAIRRQVGMVFQQFNLFPHLTVLENLTLAPMWVGQDAEAARPTSARCSSSSACASPSRPRKYPLQLSGRPAAAGGDRPRAVPDAQDHAVRRADLGARPGDDQGGARRDDRARRSRASRCCA